MDDPILPNQPDPVAPPQPPAPVQEQQRMDRLEAAMSQLTDTVRDAANRLTAAPQAPPPKTSDEFLNEMAQDPQGVIRREAAFASRQVANEMLNPAVLQVLDTANTQLLTAQQFKVDSELGEGTFDELFRPQLDKDMAQLRQVNPRALADPATIGALVDRLYGGENFPVLMERRKNLEKNMQQTGRSHLLPSGGVPRLRMLAGGEAEIPPDAEQFLREVERSTGETIDRKNYAKLYHTGVETGPGRHRTTILDFLKGNRGRTRQTQDVRRRAQLAENACEGRSFSLENSMALSGGGDRSELRPLKADGNIDHDTPDHVVGNHKGQFSGFNIVNPRPGTVHQFGTRRDILSARQRGWWIADPETDGKPAYQVMSDYVSETGTPVDQSGGLYPEYIHLVTSEENFRKLVDEQRRLSKEQLAPAGLGYLENVSREEYETGRTERGHLPTRFATREHGTFLVEDDKVLESLTPNGILREEDI